MATGAQTQEWDRPSRRRVQRYGVQAPLDVTVLRSGIPDTLPGRSVNLGEGGVAAVLAGELSPGESVGVEIHLPLASDPLRTRALVRHHDKLRSGMEFVSLSPEQLAAIRVWAGETKAEPETAVPAPIPTEAAAGKGSESGGSGGAQPPARKRPGRGWIFLLLLAATLLAVMWWHWNRGWEELESGLPKNEKVMAQPQAHVPADVMEKLVTHRVDPDYPEAARPANLRGVIVLDVVVGRDGSVVNVHALNGPDVLAQAAMDALRWWRFEPYRVDGQPVVVETTVAVEFKP
jgi:TonB family protein